MFDELLEARLNIFTDSSADGPEVVPFVRRELQRIDVPDQHRTDSTLGMFASHLFAALCRERSGEALTEFSADAAVDAALAERPNALPASQALAERARAELAAELPHTEIRVLALHFATIMAKLSKEKS